MYGKTDNMNLYTKRSLSVLQKIRNATKVIYKVAMHAIQLKMKNNSEITKIYIQLIKATEKIFTLNGKKII